MKKRVWISYLMVLFSLPLLYAQNTSIPDQNFEQALIDLAIDSDGVVNGEVLTDDINTITQLDIANKNISTLNGIEDFEALEVLNCSYNNISSLDLSNNTALTSVNCRSNMLTALNVKNGNNDDLVTLNALDNIDLKCIQADAEATPTGADWQIHENIT